MLKPKKRKDGAVILSPRLCVAVGKKLIVQDGQWVSDGFHQYSSYAMAEQMRKMHGSRGRNRRAQLPKVIRTVAGWYTRHMKKNFPQFAAVFEDGSFARKQPTEMGGILPPRSSYMSLLIRQRPQANITNERLLYTERTVKSVPDENNIHLETTFTKYVDGGYGIFSRRVNEQGEAVNSKGEPIPPVDIKGVHLKQSGEVKDIPEMLRQALTKEEIIELLREFGTKEELRIIDKVLSGNLDEETDRNVDEVTCSIMARWAKTFYGQAKSDKAGTAINLTPQMKLIVPDINVEDVYPKPGDK